MVQSPFRTPRLLAVCGAIFVRPVLAVIIAALTPNAGSAADEILARYRPWTLKREAQIVICPRTDCEPEQRPPAAYAYVIETRYGEPRHDYQPYLAFACTNDSDYWIAFNSGRTALADDERTTLGLGYHTSGHGMVRFHPFAAEGVPAARARADIPRAVLTDMAYKATWVIHVWVGSDVHSGTTFHIPHRTTGDAMSALMRHCQRPRQ
jgi:hypothetical protein